MNYTTAAQVIRWFILSLVLVGLIACATPIEKARLQADKDWARAVASAQKYNQLQRLMLQESPPVQPATTSSIAPAQPPASAQAVQPLLTPEEYRRQEIEKREKVYSDEWRFLEHDMAKRLLQRGP